MSMFREHETGTEQFPWRFLSFSHLLLSKSWARILYAFCCRQIGTSWSSVTITNPTTFTFLFRHHIIFNNIIYRSLMRLVYVPCCAIYLCISGRWHSPKHRKELRKSLCEERSKFYAVEWRNNIFNAIIMSSECGWEYSILHVLRFSLTQKWTKMSILSFKFLKLSFKLSTFHVESAITAKLSWNSRKFSCVGRKHDDMLKDRGL